MANTSQSGAIYWMIGVYGALAAVGCGMAVFGWTNSYDTLVIAGIAGAFVAIAATPIAILVGARTDEPKPASSGESLQPLLKSIDQLRESYVLSDDARRVLNRSRERELLRQAIEEDISSEDWDAAMVLVKELAERFGYRADAEEFRNRIETVRFQAVDGRVAAACEQVDRLITQLRWFEAEQEAARVTRLYPDSPRVEGLRHHVVASRDRYKPSLERRFLVAAEEERLDEAMELLRELDDYLTEAEAEPYQELARGVIGKARENLGVQFKMAVQDRAWDTAAAVGERVIREFPNTRMAEEIRAMIDQVRERATALRSN